MLLKLHCVVNKLPGSSTKKVTIWINMTTYLCTQYLKGEGKSTSKYSLFQCPSLPMPQVLAWLPGAAPGGSIDRLGRLNPERLPMPLALHVRALGGI